MSFIEAAHVREIHHARMVAAEESRRVRRAAAVERLERRAARLSQKAERISRKAESAVSQARFAVARAL